MSLGGMMWMRGGREVGGVVVLCVLYNCVVLIDNVVIWGFVMRVDGFDVCIFE